MLLEGAKSMAKELAQQTAGATQGREVQGRLLSGEAEPRARKAPARKGKKDWGRERQQGAGNEDSPLEPDWG